MQWISWPLLFFGVKKSCKTSFIVPWILHKIWGHGGEGRVVGWGGGGGGVSTTFPGPRHSFPILFPVFKSNPLRSDEVLSVHLWNVDSRPEKLQVFTHLLCFVLGVQDGQLREHPHVRTLQTCTHNRVEIIIICFHSYVSVSLVVCFCLFPWLLMPQKCTKRISRTYLHRSFCVRPHWHRGCRSNLLFHPVTLYWYRSNQSQHWLHNTKCLAKYSWTWLGFESSQKTIYF